MVLRILFRHSQKTLLSSKSQSRYGTLYQDLVGTVRLALFTTAFHTVRVLALIVCLVFGASNPLFQSVCYLLSAILTLTWDLSLSPYEGRLLTDQMLFMDWAKLAAAAGYVGLTWPREIAGETAARLCMFEIVVFLISIVVGLLLTAVQQALDMVRVIKRACLRWRRRKDEVRTYRTTDNTDAASQMQQSSIITLGQDRGMIRIQA